MAWQLHQECLHSGKRQSALVCNDTAILETCLHVMCSNVCACVRWMLKCWYLCCICVFEYLLKHSVGPTQSSHFTQGAFLVLGLVRVVVIFGVFVSVCQCLSVLVDICVFVSVCQTWCFQGQSTTARAAIGPSVCVCVSVCMWVCDSNCKFALYTQQEIVCAHVFICLCAHASKQFLHYGHSHTIKCNNICKTNDQQMLLKWQACIEIWEKLMKFWGVLFWYYSII